MRRRTCIYCHEEFAGCKITNCPNCGNKITRRLSKSDKIKSQIQRRQFIKEKNIEKIPYYDRLYNKFLTTNEKAIEAVGSLLIIGFIILLFFCFILVSLNYGKSAESITDFSFLLLILGIILKIPLLNAE